MPKDERSSVPGEERDEAIRRSGASEEKAARIANNPDHRAGVREGKAPPYEEWIRQELFEKAKRVGIKGRARMTRQQLMFALRHH